MRLRCVVSYDGSGFSGWQRQKRGRSIQAEIEQAIGTVTGTQSPVTGAGRTDAGVHALGQVAHFDSEWSRSPTALGRALNAVLPEDIVLTDTAEAPGGFHARHDALARRYHYVLSLEPAVAPFVSRTSLCWSRELDLAAVAEAVGKLIGTHDFGGFGSPMTADGSTVRRMRAAALGARGSRVTLQFEADAFLRHQVRRMVGLLLDIGIGRLPVEATDQVLARTADAPVARRAPARGLILWAVRYPPDELPWQGPRLHGVSGEDIYA